MTAIKAIRRVSFHGKGAESSRKEIKSILEHDPQASSKIYAALAHKTWILIIQNAPEGELRDWNHLILGVSAFTRSYDEPSANRMMALSGLLRESISSWATFGIGNRVPKIPYGT